MSCSRGCYVEGPRVEPMPGTGARLMFGRVEACEGLQRVDVCEEALRRCRCRDARAAARSVDRLEFEVGVRVVEVRRPRRRRRRELPIEAITIVRTCWTGPGRGGCCVSWTRNHRDRLVWDRDVERVVLVLRHAPDDRRDDYLRPITDGCRWPQTARWSREEVLRVRGRA